MGRREECTFKFPPDHLTKKTLAPQRGGDALGDTSEDLCTRSSSPPEFIRGESENCSKLESPQFIDGVSPRRRVPLSPRPLQHLPTCSLAHLLTCPGVTPSGI